MDVNQFLQGFSPPGQALIATVFTWSLTLLGASLVLGVARVSSKLLSAAQGFAAGVMLAASVWSLINPSIALAEEQGILPWLPAAVGVLLGAGFVGVIDRFLPHLHPGFTPNQEKAEGPKVGWSQAALLLAAMTLHNIPEGMAVGVSYGAAALESTSLGSALALTLGIGIQNIPEGLAVALAMRAIGLSRMKSFMFGQASALVEPLGGVLGAVFVVGALPVLPYALAFAAGAMIFVVIEELIPESQNSGHTDLATLSALGGFVCMMVLDVALG